MHLASASESASPTGNEARFSASAGGITLLQASFADHAFERHSHDCFALGVTTYGVQRFRCKGQRYDSRVGDLVLFNPDEDHDGAPGSADGFRYLLWYVPEAFVRSCLDRDAGPGGTPYFAAPHRTDRRMAAAFGRQTLALLDSKGESLRAESLAAALIGTLLSRYGEQPQAGDALPSPGGIPLALVKDYIHAHFQHDLTVAELAGVAGLSRAHLTRAFAAAFHMPPHMYLNSVRIAQAQTLIRLGLPLAETAVACGFADQSHLTRRFKGSVGVSPAGWRRMTCGERHQAGQVQTISAR
jgi:AraC-like DNA-binding protein